MFCQQGRWCEAHASADTANTHAHAGPHTANASPDTLSYPGPHPEANATVLMGNMCADALMWCIFYDLFVVR